MTLDSITNRPVDWVGYMVAGPSLYVKIGNVFAAFTRISTDKGPAVKVEIGTIIDDNDEFESLVLTNAYTKALIGKKFTGIEGDVIMFGAYGAKLEAENIRFVRKPM